MDQVLHTQTLKLLQHQGIKGYVIDNILSFHQPSTLAFIASKYDRTATRGRYFHIPLKLTNKGFFCCLLASQLHINDKSPESCCAWPFNSPIHK